MPKLGSICITNKTPEIAIIDIEGIIGIPEWWQFDDPSDRISTFDKFKKKCNEIKDLKAKDITVNIRSMGGNVNHALLIHDALCLLSANITTVCYGYTASAATLIAQSGKERQISSNALYLVHQCLSSARGNINDIKDAINIMERTNDLIVNLYAQRSGKTVEHFQELINRRNGNGEWLSPQGAIDLGLADKIVTVSGVVNMDPDLFECLGCPSIPEDLIPEPPVITNKTNFMTKIKNSLTALWAFCGFPSDVTEQEITAEHLTSVNNELATRQSTIDNLTSEVDRLKADIKTKDTRITDLENQITVLNGAPGATTTGTTNSVDGNSNDGDSMLGTIGKAKDLYNLIKDI